MSTVPLTPRRGGSCIADSALAPADIIVTTANAAVSRVIRGFTGSSVSHCMLYASRGRVIEAIHDGVVCRALSKALVGATLAVAYRCKDLNPRVAEVVVAYARSKVGRRYDLTGALGGGAHKNPAVCTALLYPGLGATASAFCAVAGAGMLQSPSRYYCSELVLESFKQAGIYLIAGDPSTSVPEDIVTAWHRGKLQYVGHLR